MGEFLKRMPKADGGDAQRTRFQPGTESPATLAEIGITKKQSASAQKLAEPAAGGDHWRLVKARRVAPASACGLCGLTDRVLAPSRLAYRQEFSG